ncbi:nucleotidyltransferase domain-containing protein [candidate division KSB1 bacterium]|nr:nucleotidyltransferase domain-containing protein [candidate division KSB1 bacterium]
MEHTTSILGKRCAKFSEIMLQAKRIVEKFNPEKIILFGSYAQGNPTLESDVDLLVIIDRDASIWKLSSEITGTLDHTFPLDIVVRTQQQIIQRLEAGDFFIEDIVHHGKVIYERTDPRVGA